MKLLRIILVVLLSVSFILFPVVQAAELVLPSGELIAPTIEHTPIEKDIYAGQSIDIKATVTDNVGIKNVILFYRDANTAEFKRLKMNRDLDSFIYTAQLTTTDSPRLEYYIQAIDMTENISALGYSFSPLILTVLPAVINNITVTDNSDTNAAATFKTDKEKKKSGISKWVWIGLGVAAGAALSGGGGGTSGPSSTTTGGLTISGPTPPP